MTSYMRRVPQASLHLMAFGWSAAVLATLTAWMTLPMPLWLLPLAYLLPALARPRNGALSIAVTVLVAAASALFVPFGELFFTVLVLLAQSTRALTLSRYASVTFLRSEQKRGMALLLLVVLARAIVGRPSAWLIGLFAVLYLLGALAGLPLAQSREAGGNQIEGAQTGLRLSLALTLVATVIASIIGLLRLAVEHRAFAFLQPILVWLFKPIAYVLGYVVQFFVGFLLGHRSLPRNTNTRLRNPTLHFPQHAQSTAFRADIEIALIIVAALVVARVIFWLYRRQKAKEVKELPDVNAPHPGENVPSWPVRQRSRAVDYGEGARRLVRRTVGMHVRDKHLPPGTTARSYARDQGWEEEWLYTYEHARYGFAQPLPESKARAFVASFQRRFRMRKLRGKDPGS